jgi:hypothetical protein
LTICDRIDNDLAAIVAPDSSLLNRHPAFFDALGQILDWARTFVSTLEVT